MFCLSGSVKDVVSGPEILKNVLRTEQTSGIGVLESESLTAFGSAALQDGASAAGCHSGSESTFTGSFHFRGLIRSFHVFFTFLSGSSQSTRVLYCQLSLVFKITKNELIR